MWSRYMTLDQLLSVKHNETRPYLILRSILTARVERERVGLTTRKQLPPAPPPPPPPPPPQAIKPIRLDHGSSPLQHNLDSRPLSRGNITTQKWTRKETQSLTNELSRLGLLYAEMNKIDFATLSQIQVEKEIQNNTYDY